MSKCAKNPGMDKQLGHSRASGNPKKAQNISQMLDSRVRGNDEGYAVPKPQNSIALALKTAHIANHNVMVYVFHVLSILLDTCSC